MTKRRWRNRDKRMEAAVELRRQGFSLRRIGAELDVDARTIRRDLSRWEREQVEAALLEMPQQDGRAGHRGASAGQRPGALPQQEDQQ